LLRPFDFYSTTGLKAKNPGIRGNRRPFTPHGRLTALASGLQPLGILTACDLNATVVLYRTLSWGGAEPVLIPEIVDRRSIRRFQGRTVEADKIAEILESARLAPSSINLQHFRVIVATSPEDRRVLREAAYNSAACCSAPVILVCMADLSADSCVQARVTELVEDGAITPPDATKMFSGSGRPFTLKVGREFALVNAAIATEHMVLQAQHLGLGTCWVHHFDHDEVRQHYKLPESGLLLTLLPLGYPAERPTPRRRRSSVLWSE